jgi:hypothetical protein
MTHGRSLSASQPKNAQNKTVNDAARLHYAVAPTASVAFSATLACDMVNTDDELGELDTVSQSKGSFLEHNVHSGVNPHQAYVHPFTHHRRASSMGPALITSYLARSERHASRVRHASTSSGRFRLRSARAADLPPSRSCRRPRTASHAR